MKKAFCDICKEPVDSICGFGIETGENYQKIMPVEESTAHICSKCAATIINYGHVAYLGKWRDDRK